MGVGKGEGVNTEVVVRIVATEVGWLVDEAGEPQLTVKTIIGTNTNKLLIRRSIVDLHGGQRPQLKRHDRKHALPEVNGLPCGDSADAGRLRDVVGAVSTAALSVLPRATGDGHFAPPHHHLDRQANRDIIESNAAEYCQYWWVPSG